MLRCKYCGDRVGQHAVLDTLRGSDMFGYPCNNNPTQLHSASHTSLPQAEAYLNIHMILLSGFDRS